MSKATLTAETREEFGKGAARALRRDKKVPAVIYGGKGEPVHITLDRKTLVKYYEAGSFKSKVIDLDVAGKPSKVIPRDIDLHPVSELPQHVDFQRVEAGQKILVSVPVRFINSEKSPGIKRGGVLNMVRRDVELYADVDSVPEFLVCDLSGTKVKDSIHISAIELPEGVEPAIKDRDFTVATIAGRGSKEEEESTGTTAEGAEAEESEEAEESTEE